MPHVQLIRHSHPSVQLNGILTDETAGLAHLNLEGRHRFLRFIRVALVQAHGGHVHEGLGLLVLHEHVDHAVLEYLKFTNGLTELLPGLAVFHGVLVEHLHAADGFRAHGHDAFVNHLLIGT